jgi:carboxymethylenebutenolidase
MEVEFPANGVTSRGYLALPSRPGRGGVLVLQEWWGLNRNIRDVADRLARSGYSALAPDLYHGMVVTEGGEAEKLYMALNIARAEADLRGAAQYLRGREEVGGAPLGIVGFCMGGQLALFAAATTPEHYSAVVDFYGVHPNVTIDESRLQAAVLAVFAERDAWISQVEIDRLRSLLARSGAKHEVHVYGNTEHGFLNDQRGAFNAVAARDAWRRTINWLEQEVEC